MGGHGAGGRPAGGNDCSVVSPRVLLNKEYFANASLAELGFESYSDTTSVSPGRIDMGVHPRIACVVDSVHRLSLSVLEDELVGGVPSCVHVTPELDLLVRCALRAPPAMAAPRPAPWYRWPQAPVRAAWRGAVPRSAERCGTALACPAG